MSANIILMIRTLALSMLLATVNCQPDKPPTNILVFSKTAGFRHGSIPAGQEALRSLCRENGLQMDTTENAGLFTDTNLSQYNAVVFLNTTGDVLNAEQEAAFERFIRAGGGYMGIHAATDTKYDWPWYGALVGGYFNGHPAIQQATLLIDAHGHPATAHLGDSWQRTDEWYNFRDLNPAVQVLLRIDESSYQGGTMGADHPMSWYHAYDGGRAFYTALGHTEESYNEPDFRRHLLGGLLYVAGRD